MNFSPLSVRYILLSGSLEYWSSWSCSRESNCRFIWFQDRRAICISLVFGIPPSFKTFRSSYVICSLSLTSLTWNEVPELFYYLSCRIMEIGYHYTISTDNKLQISIYTIVAECPCSTYSTSIMTLSTCTRNIPSF